MSQSPLVAILSNLDIQYTDKIIPGRGEPYVDPTTGMVVTRYRRDGVDGEYTLMAKVSFTTVFVNPNVEKV